MTSDRVKKESMSHVAFPLSPFITGGGQEFGLRSGTENVASIVGFGKAVSLAVEQRARDAKNVDFLRKRLFQGIRGIVPRAVLNGPAFGPRRLPNNLNIALPGINAAELLIKMDLQGVSASAGPACSARAAEPSPTLSALGYPEARIRGSIRFTLGRMTTSREIDAAIRIIRATFRGTRAVI